MTSQASRGLYLRPSRVHKCAVRHDPPRWSLPALRAATKAISPKGLNALLSGVSSQWMTLSKRTTNGAIAGGIASLVWAITEPLDKPVFKCEYSDVELLGKAVTRGRLWPIAGLIQHLLNGALFGAVYANVAPKTPVPAPLRGVAAGMTEHLASWPAVGLADRFHPARDELVKLSGNRNAFAQATWRHLLFGGVLGAVEAKLNRDATSA